MIYDVVIVGGGPGGSTLARRLNSKYKVLIIDKRNLDEYSNYDRNKCCGGLLAPDAQKVLSQFSLGLPKEIMVDPQMFSVKTIDLDNDIEKYYQRHYINVDRELFDRWLFSLIPPHVDKMMSTVFKGYEEINDCIEVDIINNGKPQKVFTKLLIGGDGSTSKVRRLAFSEKKMENTYASIQQWYKTSEQLPHYISVFDKEVTDFYSWVIQKDNYAIIGSAIKDYSNAKEKFDILIKKLKAEGYELGECVKKEGTWIKRPRTIGQIKLYKGNIALVGEAGGFISPSSAEGISYALRSGDILANCINHSIKGYGKIYKKKSLGLKINVTVKSLKAILMYNTFIRKLIMKTGVLSMKVEKKNSYKKSSKSWALNRQLNINN